MGKMLEKNAYIQFKPNFYDKKQCRFINPSKTELVIIKESYPKYHSEYI